MLFQSVAGFEEQMIGTSDSPMSAGEDVSEPGGVKTQRVDDKLFSSSLIDENRPWCRCG